jgi:hypothetical protein
MRHLDVFICTDKCEFSRENCQGTVGLYVKDPLSFAILQEWFLISTSLEFNGSIGSNVEGEAVGFETLKECGPDKAVYFVVSGGIVYRHISPFRKVQCGAVKSPD